jgi:class 3 adenylate cyclase
MACAGLKFVENKLTPAQKLMKPTERALQAAILFLRHAKENPYIAGKYFVLKLGVHYGNCIFGVLGYQKPQFSLIGDTVNTTSRHCTTGADDTINLSQAAWEQVSHLSDYTFKVKSDLFRSNPSS